MEREISTESLNKRLVAFNIINKSNNSLIRSNKGIPGLLYFNEYEDLNISYFIDLIIPYITLRNFKDIQVATIDYNINDDEDDDFTEKVYSLTDVDIVSDSDESRKLITAIVEDVIKELKIPSINDIGWFLDDNSETIIIEETILNFIRAKLQEVLDNNNSINKIISYTKNIIDNDK